jgi:hypothetical protein
MVLAVAKSKVSYSHALSVKRQLGADKSNDFEQQQDLLGGHE